ncbi:b(0,+)-type amino acid transporter 1 [Amphibalanus amphitrite]|uniref:b(0,+)-type amino acid transporter 1 n=1 Tax=Amphibalanus amphitrite TaxID=1232801 RepID=A0A6A4VGX3_AMPAM|nr:b(0,+)-type amino acid transporter 1 [Amphibalanus amphitrite]
MQRQSRFTCTGKPGHIGGESTIPPARLREHRTHSARQLRQCSHETRIPRTVGAFSGTAIIVGTMIGSGIFVSPKGVLERTGSVALSLLVWLGCGVLSTLGALCYIELGLVIPESGGEFSYLFRGFGPLHRFFGPLPAFLASWSINLITKPASTAILSLAFAEYCVQPFFSVECPPPPAVIPLVAAAACWLITIAHCYSVRMGTGMQNLFTVSKLSAVALVVAGGVYSLYQGNTRHLATGFQGSTSSASDVATAFYSGLWAYDGWNNLNYLTEEVVNPARNLTLAIVVALPLVTICYLLINVAYLSVLSPRELLASPAVAVTFADRVLGPVAFLIPVGVALSVAGALNGTILSTSRICFASARQGHMVDILSFIHARHLTPAPALLFNAVLTSGMIAAGNIDNLIDFFSFSVWIFYGLVMLALLILRRTQPELPRPYRVHLWIPVVVLLVSMYLVVGPIADAPKLEYVYVLCFLLFGVVVYTPCVFYGHSAPGMRRLTELCQKALEVVPTD